MFSCEFYEIFIKTPFLQNTSKRLLLFHVNYSLRSSNYWPHFETCWRRKHSDKTLYARTQSTVYKCVPMGPFFETQFPQVLMFSRNNVHIQWEYWLTNSFMVVMAITLRFKSLVTVFYSLQCFPYVVLLICTSELSALPIPLKSQHCNLHCFWESCLIMNI